MIKNGIQGSIVHTASKAWNGPPNMCAYGSSKAAVLTMMRSAAKDFGPEHKIRVNSISPCYIGPGYMWTRQCELQASMGPPHMPSDPKAVEEKFINTPNLKRQGSVDEVISVVLFLFSDDASYVNGINIDIDGGM